LRVKTATAINQAIVLETTMDCFMLQAVRESTDAHLAFSNRRRFGVPITPMDITINDLCGII